MYKILLVEDDFALCEAIKNQIEMWGNEVKTVTDFTDVASLVKSYSPQLILLDIMLPFYNGYHWCSEIRKFSTVPIVFISSANDNMNIVMAITLGADDFIAKPVEPMVLNAKIKALLRRTYELPESPALMECHGAVLNLDNYTVYYKNKTSELTKNEFKIFKTLLENKGKTVSRETLMNVLWQSECFVEENTLTVNVNRLRKRLENLGLNNVITTKLGCGYIIL